MNRLAMSDSKILSRNSSFASHSCKIDHGGKNDCIDYFSVNNAITINPVVKGKYNQLE